ncbi:hypothetical protein ACWGN5_41815 [Streptomyces sp. NPDC055815]
MILIHCPACEGTYHLVSSGTLQCPTCDRQITPRDISLDGQEAWAVDPAGRLGYVTDPAASLQDMDDAIEEYASAPDRDARRLALNHFQAGLTAYAEARETGLAQPRRYTGNEIRRAVNDAADLINEKLNLDEPESDIVNLCVNASITLMENPKASFEQVVTQNYGITVEEIMGWWGWGYE